MEPFVDAGAEDGVNESDLKALHHVVVPLVALSAYVCHPVTGRGKTSSGEKLQQSHEGQVRVVNDSKHSQQQRRHGECVAETAAQDWRRSELQRE